MVDTIKKTLKILMIAMSLDYRIHGGLSRHTYELCKALNKLGCHVYVSCMENDLMNIKNKIRVPSLPGTGFSFLDFLSFNTNLPRKTRTYDINIIHSQGDHGFVFALIKKKPFIVTAHASYRIGLQVVPSLRHHPSPYFRVLAEKYTFMKADKVVVVSRSVGKSIQNDYGVKEENIVFIPNGVDTRKFNPNIDGEIFRKKYEVNGPLLLCVTRLAIGRFVHDLIPMVKAVAKEIPQVKTIIVGDGPLRHYLERLRDQQGLTKSIIFVGAKGDDQLPHFYNAADLYILPVIYSEKEFTMLEALACGKPVVYTRRIKMQIEDEEVYNAKCALNSPIIAVNNNKDFASCIAYLLQNEKNRKALGLAARKTITEHFSWEKIAQKTIDIYKSVL